MDQKEKRQWIKELFENRYTCKGYDPDKKVSDEDFQTILEAGRLSPSSMGLEPWKFVLLNNETVKQKIRPFAWGAEKSLDGASHFVLVLARSPQTMRYDSDYVEYIQKDIQQYPLDKMEEKKEKTKDFQLHDFKLLESERAMFDWTCKNVYIALANMLTTAAVLGVDSTPMEGFHQEKVEEVLVEQGVIDPKEYRLCCMVAFGYTNRDHRPKTRRPMEEVFEVVD